MAHEQRIADARNLLLLLICAFGIRLVFFYGMGVSDHLVYSGQAHKVVSGQWLDNSFYEASTRWGFLLPAALLYRLLGVNEVASSLWAMSLSLGTIVVGSLLGRHLGGRQAGWLAAVLLSIFPLEIAYASQLLADGPISFWLLLSLFWFVKGDASESLQHRRRYFVGCGVALGFAYATKFVAILICPFFLLIALIRRKIDWQQIWIATGFVVVLSIELLMFSYYVGNAWFRLDSILADRTATAVQSAGEKAATGLDVLSNSVWHYLYWMGVDIHHVGGTFLLLAALAITVSVAPHWLSRPEKFGTSSWLVWLWGGTLLVMLSCYPISMSPYVAVYKMPNYMLMFTAPLLVVLATLLARVPRCLQHLSVMMVGVSAFFCVLVSHESHRERSDNARQLVAFAAVHKDRPLYAMKRNIDLLVHFDQFAPAGEYKIFTTNKYGAQAKPAADLSSLRHAYVAIDHHFLRFDKDGTHVPAQILQPPSTWRVVLSYQRQPHWLQALGINIFEMLHHSGLVNEKIAEAATTKLRKWSHTDPLVVYAVD